MSRRAADACNGAVTVHLTTVDALAVGQNLRTLARDRRTPLGVRDAFERVGSQLCAEARLAIVGGGR